MTTDGHAFEPDPNDPEFCVTCGHPPADHAQVSPGVALLTPAEQIEWFRAHREIRMSEQEWTIFHPSSLLHSGVCCPSCIDDINDGYRDWDENVCCCRGYSDADVEAPDYAAQTTTTSTEPNTATQSSDQG